MKKFLLACLFLVLLPVVACAEGKEGILNLPFPWNVIASTWILALLVIVTFLWKMIKGVWWWKQFTKK